MLEYVFNKVRSATLFKKDSNSGVFLLKFAKFSKTSFLQNTSGATDSEVEVSIWLHRICSFFDHNWILTGQERFSD